MTSQYSHSKYDPKNTNNTWYKVVSFVPESSRVLDIGCSSGNLGKALKQYKNCEVIGMDINANDVAEAKTKLDKAFVLDIENQKPPKLEKFDVIVFADVLEHMKDPVIVLKKVKPLLKIGGRVVFSIPNMAHVSVRLDLLDGSFRHTETGLLDYTHLHFYDDVEVKRIFSEAGMTIEQFDCPSFDYPDELVKRKLEKVGLRATKSFLKKISQPQAVYFEYVGFAINGANKKHARFQTSSPLDEVAAVIDHIEKTYAKRLETLTEKVRLSQEHIRKLEALLIEARTSKAKKAVKKVLHKKPKDVQ